MAQLAEVDLLDFFSTPDSGTARSQVTRKTTPSTSVAARPAASSAVQPLPASAAEEEETFDFTSHLSSSSSAAGPTSPHNFAETDYGSRDIMRREGFTNATAGRRYGASRGGSGGSGAASGGGGDGSWTERLSAHIHAAADFTVSPFLALDDRIHVFNRMELADEKFGISRKLNRLSERRSRRAPAPVPTEQAVVDNEGTVEKTVRSRASSTAKKTASSSRKPSHVSSSLSEDDSESSISDVSEPDSSSPVHSKTHSRAPSVASASCAPVSLSARGSLSSKKGEDQAQAQIGAAIPPPPLCWMKDLRFEQMAVEKDAESDNEEAAFSSSTRSLSTPSSLGSDVDSTRHSREASFDFRALRFDDSQLQDADF